MIRPLFVAPFGGEGGAENVLLRILGGLPEEYEPHGLVMSRGPFADKLRNMGLPTDIEHLPGKRSVPQFPFAARSIAERLEHWNISFIHANGTKAGLLGIWLARAMGVPLLWMKHGHDYDFWSSRTIGPYCDRVVCVSQAVADRFPARLHDRVSVVYPGVEVPPVAVAAGGTEPLVVSVGRLDPHKGVPLLIDAIEVLRGRGLLAQLEIAGPINPKSPDHGEELDGRIGDHELSPRVTLRGWVDDLGAFYERSRVVAIASHPPRRGVPAEGTPLVLLEGMARSRPVVAPDEAGIREIVGDAGTLVKMLSAEAFADALQTYLTDPQLAERVGRIGRERVEARFTVARMVSELTGHYRELLDRDS